MITERTIVNALIILGVLLIMPFIVSSALWEGDYIPLAIIGGVFAVIGAFFLFKDRLSLLPLIGGGIHGPLNFVPLKLTTSNVLSVLLVLYYFTGYVMIRQKRIRLGMPRFFWPIMVLLTILLYHNHSLGLRVVGSDEEGQKPVFMVYLAVLAYFAGINVGTPTVQFVSRLPWYTVLVSAVGALPFLASTIVPGTAPVLSLFTSQVNVAAYANSQLDAADAGDDMTRYPILGAIGLPLQSYLLCYYPIGTWLRPERWWVLGLSIMCLVFAAETGYRSTFFVYAMLLFSAAWCFYTWRSLVLPIGGALVLLVVVAASINNLIALPANKLPPVIQRTLSFLPADWDQEALDSAASSNHFRQNIIDVYMQEYFWKSPLIGNGYNIDAEAFHDYGDAISSGVSKGDQDYYMAKLFIEGKMFHTGWVSLYDIVGIVGFIAFLALAGAEIYTIAGWIFEAKADRRSSLFPCYVWLFCNLIAMIVAFFVVFGDFSAGLQVLLINGVVISQITDVRKISDIPDVRSESESSSDSARPAGARYGYGYQTRY